jgi:hypothetical protein
MPSHSFMGLRVAVLIVWKSFLLVLVTSMLVSSANNIGIN